MARGTRKVEVAIVGDATSLVNAFGKAGVAATGFKKTAERMQSVGRKMTMGVTLPIVGIGAAAFKMSSDFEASMSKITGLVGISQKDVQAMGKGVLDLSKSTGKSATELSEGLFVITSAGLRGKTAMDALAASGKASAAGLGEVKDIGRAVAGAMNAYGSATLSAADATDIITATARAGNFETSQFAGALGRVLPFAKGAKASLSEVGGSVALLTRTNGDAAQSITQMSALFRAFVAPSAQTAKMLGEVGLSAGDMRDKIGKDGVVAALKMLDKGLGGNREKLGLLLGSSEAAGAAFQLLDADSKTLAETFGVTAKASGITEDAFGAFSNTAEFKTATAIASMQAALIELGVIITPVVTKVITALTSAISAFTSLPGPIKNATVGVAAFLATVGPLLWIGGKIAASMIALKAAFTAVSASVVKAMASLAAMRASFTAVSAASVGLAPGLTLAGAGMSKFGVAATRAGSIGKTFGRGLLSLAGGPIGVTIMAVGTVAAIIGGDLVRSFFGGKSAADIYAEAQRNAATATDQLRQSTFNLVGSLVGVEQAETAETAASVASVAANRAKAEAIRDYGRGSAQAKLAIDNARSAELNLAQATSTSAEARNRAKTSTQQQIDGLIKTGDTIRTLAARATGLRPPLALSGQSLEEFEKKSAAAGRTFMRTNETVRQQQQVARDLAPSLKALGGPFKEAAAAALALANAKTPKQYNKALADLTLALGGTKKESQQAGGAITKNIFGIGAQGTQIATAETSLRGGLDRMKANAEDMVPKINAPLKNIGGKGSPTVASFVTKNMQDIKNATSNGMSELSRSSRAGAQTVTQAIKGEFAKSAQPLSKAMKAAIIRAVKSAKTAAVGMAGSFASLFGQASTAGRSGALTDREATFQAAQDIRQRESLVRSQTDAEAAEVEKLAALNAATAEDRVQAQRDLTDAQRAASDARQAILDFDEQQAIQKERDSIARDAETNEAKIKNLAAQFATGKINAATFRTELDSILDPLGGGLGATLGEAFVLEYSTALETLKRQLDVIAKVPGAAAGSTPASVPEVETTRAAYNEAVANVKRSLRKSYDRESNQFKKDNTFASYQNPRLRNWIKQNKAKFGLADGGITKGPTTALIGEAGREAVIPLEGTRARRMLRATGMGGSVINLTFNGVLDAREAARVLQPELNRLIRVAY
jgi:TP901 family phage tail tape measure protein